MGRGWVNAVREASGAKKGRLFTKIAKEIAVAVKMGGGNPEGNPRLRSALRDAQKNSMPKDTVDRAIKRGLGSGDESALEEITYEGYGPHGVAVLVECLTDNRNRTVQDLRAAFVRGKGNMGESGSVAWMFDRVAHVLAKSPSASVDAEEAAINAGADEVVSAGEPQQWEFFAAPAALAEVENSLTQAKWEIIRGELSYKPKTPMELSPEQEKDLQHFLELVDDNDDVKRLHLAL
jgi:YebC/PmpR family DNA-binding regulatory protein